MEYTRQETMAWHQRLHEHQVQRDRQLEQAFQEMAADRCPQLQPAQCPSGNGAGRVPQLQPAASPPPQPRLLTFEEFVAQNAGPSPVSSSPIYSLKAYHAFQHSHISR